METETWYEWGYRLPSGDTVWQQDYGTDGTWTPNLPEMNMSHVDIYDGSEASSIRSALEASDIVGATIVRRYVVTARGEAEDVETV